LISGDVKPAYQPFATFALIWAVASMVHQLSFPFWGLTWQGWLLNVAIFAVVLQPRCVLRFTCLVVASLLKLYHDLPFVPNHMFFEGMLHVSILLGLPWAMKTWKGPRARTGELLRELGRRFWIFVLAVGAKALQLVLTPDNVPVGAVTSLAMIFGLGWGLFGREPLAAVGDHFFHQVAPVMRVAVVLVYWWAGLQKLNWDYLDPEVSCAAVLHKGIAGYFPFLPIPTDALALRAAVWGSLLFEFGIPVLLLIPRTRFAGFVAAVGFHLWLSVHEHAGIYSFSALVFAVLYVFLPETSAVELHKFWRGRCARLGGGDEETGRRRARTGVIALFLAGLVGQWALYFSLGQTRKIFDYANRVGFALWFLWGLWLGFCYLQSFVKARGRPLTWPNRAVWTPAWIVVLFITWNGLNPWIGLKTQTSFAMFSNLRGEGAGNHLFLKRIDLFPYQADMIEVVASEPDILAAPARPRSLRYWANPGHIFPRFELRRLLSETEGDVRVTYRRNGELHEAKRANGVATPAELFEPLPWYQYKFLWFRRHESLTEPMHCTH
jgi:hypothetical protein